MKKLLILLILLVMISQGLSWSFALNTASSGRVVDNFKARHEKILFESLPFSASGTNEILEYEYRMNGLDALRSRMAEVENYYTEKKDDAARERVSLETAIATLDRSMQATETAISDTKSQILAKQQRIHTLEYASIELKKKIAEHRKIILSYLANLYSEGNLIFDDDGNVDMMKALILTSEDTDFYLTDMTYKALVSQLGQKFVDEYRALVREYYINGVRANEEKQGLQELQAGLERQNAMLAAQKQEREHLLEITK